MSRTERSDLLLGKEATEKLRGSYVAVFGIGGVGSYAAEALARAGVGRILLVDNDTVSESNINRQLIARIDTVGQPKTAVMAERIAAINPDAVVEQRQDFFAADNADSFPFGELDYIVDAIDSVSSKVELICRAKGADVPIISCMGTGNKLDPTAFRVADIAETSVCPLARIIRKECRKRGIEKLKVVYSTEDPIDCTLPADDPAWAELPEGRNALPGSVCFVPAAAGMVLAGEVIKDLIR